MHFGGALSVVSLITTPGTRQQLRPLSVAATALCPPQRYSHFFLFSTPFFSLHAPFKFQFWWVCGHNNWQIKVTHILLPQQINTTDTRHNHYFNFRTFPQNYDLLQGFKFIAKNCKISLYLCGIVFILYFLYRYFLRNFSSAQLTWCDVWKKGLLTNNYIQNCWFFFYYVPVLKNLYLH